jgi:hypothetical protein
MKYIILLALIIEIASLTSEEEAYIFNYFVEHGLTEAGAAGLMANLKAESNMNSVIYEHSKKKRIGLSDQEYVNRVNNGQYSEYNFVHDSAGFGLAQWTYYSRKQNLLNACRGRIGDLNCQLGFLMSELRNSYRGVYNTLTSSNDVRTCAVKVLLDFERPANQGIGVQNTRTSYAQTYYNGFAGGPTPTPTPTPTSGPTPTPTYSTYTVRKGDNLTKIARMFGTTVNAIVQLNGISNPNLIYPGQVLKIPK